VGLRKAVVWLGLVEHDDMHFYDEDPAGDGSADQAEAPHHDGPSVRSVSALSAPGYQIATVRPQTFQDALTVGEYFRHDIPVIINLHDLETPDAKRIVDFASGLIFGRRGDIERLSTRVFLIVPAGYSILNERNSLADSGFFNQT
jgi:cell division inhibitor SepF